MIENDFHERKDLTPNVCAVYVEEEFRRRGIAGALLDFVCEDMKGYGIDTLFLLTDHTSFMKGMDGSFSVWYREMGRKKWHGCMCTNRRIVSA